ncbi:ParB/RepB/Spo0J family partition protein [Streptomyces sp. NPDC058426]|uniref:ParB/RepB/Spo0J family partition protein n=1 Tax=Streptomyces sp. NPDC058426 TaxID=3346493 RepID=UPI00365BA2F8
MTSKSDTLGAAPAFGAARSVRSSRRTAIDRTINGDDTASTVTELPVTLISDNPDNPRNHLRNLDETVDTVREVGIILPIVIATADAYLKDRADRATDLDAGSQYVVVDGHRRLEAARRVGLATIPVRVDNARVTTDEVLLESAFIANYHRDDMTDLETANALKQLVDFYGSQTKAAKRLGLSQSTISSKLSLLKLSPELQKDLATGTRKSEHVRNLGKLPPAEQKKKADERAAASLERGQPAQLSRRDNPEPDPAPPLAEEIPEPRPHHDDDGFPYNDGIAAAQRLISTMPAAQYDTMLDLLVEHGWQQDSSRS